MMYDESKLNLEKIILVTTDSVPAMVGSHQGFVKKFKK